MGCAPSVCTSTGDQDGDEASQKITVYIPDDGSEIVLVRPSVPLVIPKSLLSSTNSTTHGSCRSGGPPTAPPSWSVPQMPPLHNSFTSLPKVSTAPPQQPPLFDSSDWVNLSHNNTSSSAPVKTTSSSFHFTVVKSDGGSSVSSNKSES
eukprot:PhF_6_TR11408/c0_g1_i1/m.18361